MSVKLSEPVRVIQLLGRDRCPVIIHQTVEGDFTAELRDGVLDGIGKSQEDAILSLAEHLKRMAALVRKSAQ